MAVQVLQFASVIPAGTLETAPVTLPLAIDNWDIESIDLEVPAGPAGLMGFAVYNNGVQWIPRTPGTWLVWDDVQASWSLEQQPSGSGWSIVGYNLGTYPHTVTSRWHVNPTNPPSVAQVTPTIVINTTAADSGNVVTL